MAVDWVPGDSATDDDDDEDDLDITKVVGRELGHNIDKYAAGKSYLSSSLQKTSLDSRFLADAQWHLRRSHRNTDRKPTRRRFCGLQIRRR